MVPMGTAPLGMEFITASLPAALPRARLFRARQGSDRASRSIFKILGTDSTGSALRWREIATYVVLLVTLASGCSRSSAPAPLPPNSSVEVARPAIDSSRLLPAAPTAHADSAADASAGVSVPWTLVGISGTAAVISYGSSPCRQAHFSVNQAKSYVLIRVRMDAPTTTGCSDYAVRRLVTLTLTRPLGNRQLLHAVTP